MYFQHALRDKSIRVVVAMHEIHYLKATHTGQVLQWMADLLLGEVVATAGPMPSGSGESMTRLVVLCSCTVCMDREINLESLA